MDTLVKLFGNGDRIKLLRFLLLNGKKSYTEDELRKKNGLSVRSIKKEIPALKRSGVLRTKVLYIKNTKSKKKSRVVHILLNTNFKNGAALKNFFVTTSSLSSRSIVRRLNTAGKVKLVVTSGVFLENPESRLDLLVVGDRLDKEAVNRSVHSFEKILGRDLRYALLETTDFNYRVNVFDRLVRDILDYPHQKILNKIGLS